jgi:hypothetical protein
VSVCEAKRSISNKPCLQEHPFGWGYNYTDCGAKEVRELSPAYFNAHFARVHTPLRYIRPTLAIHAPKIIIIAIDNSDFEWRCQYTREYRPMYGATTRYPGLLPQVCQTSQVCRLEFTYQSCE